MRNQHGGHGRSHAEHRCGRRRRRGRWGKDGKMPVRVGFVGCGGMATGHMNNWAQMKERGEEVAMAAFCDVDRSRAETQANRFGGRAYDDFRRMLDQEELDAIYVVVP